MQQVIWVADTAVCDASKRLGLLMQVSLVMTNRLLFTLPTPPNHWGSPAGAETSRGSFNPALCKTQGTSMHVEATTLNLNNTSEDGSAGYDG